MSKSDDNRDALWKQGPKFMRDRDGVFREVEAAAKASARAAPLECDHTNPTTYERGLCLGCGRTRNEIAIDRGEDDNGARRAKRRLAP